MVPRQVLRKLSHLTERPVRGNVLSEQVQCVLPMLGGSVQLPEAKERLTGVAST